jgi:hypothetical protein
MRAPDSRGGLHHRVVRDLHLLVRAERAANLRLLDLNVKSTRRSAARSPRALPNSIDWRILSNASGAAMFSIAAASFAVCASPFALDKSMSAMISRSMVWIASSAWNPSFFTASTDSSNANEVRVNEESPADLGLFGEKELEFAKMLVSAQRGTFEAAKLKDKFKERVLELVEDRSRAVVPGSSPTRN